MARLVGILLLLCGAVAASVGLWPRTLEAAPMPAPFRVAPDAAAPAADATPPPSLPANTLSIPSLGVTAPLLPGSVTLAGSGRTLQIPADPSQLTLYDKGSHPCDQYGTVLIAGHVAYQGTHGALWPLADVAPHAPVYIACADGSVTRWEVVSVAVTAQADLAQDIFTTTGPLRVELVTCGGPVTASGHYSHNVTVELVPSPSS